MILTFWEMENLETRIYDKTIKSAYFTNNQSKNNLNVDAYI
jgi:hypothetical protein